MYGGVPDLTWVVPDWSCSGFALGCLYLEVESQSWHHDQFLECVLFTIKPIFPPNYIQHNKFSVPMSPRETIFILINVYVGFEFDRFKVDAPLCEPRDTIIYYRIVS